MNYVINDPEKPTKYLSYTIDNIGNFMLSYEPPANNYYIPLMCEVESSTPLKLWTL
jgi:hypothetical protein